MRFRLLTVRELANKIVVSTGSVHSIFHDAVRCKQPDLWAARTSHFHQDNASAHSAHLIQTFCAKRNIHVVRQFLCFPYIASCGFWLFPKMKIPLKGYRFELRGDIMRDAAGPVIFPTMG